MTDKLHYNLDATDAAEIRFLVDAETLGWLERESVRTGISLEKIASAMLRKACNETPALGAPGATVSAGRAETAEVRCDARRRSAMKDTCPYCEAGMIETDEAFSLDGPNGPIAITGGPSQQVPGMRRDNVRAQALGRNARVQIEPSFHVPLGYVVGCNARRCSLCVKSAHRAART